MIPTIADKPFQLFTIGQYRRPTPKNLSPLQQRVYDLKIKGYTNSEIAKWLDLTDKAVEMHCIEIKIKGWKIEEE